jgi:hypothetical protein
MAYPIIGLLLQAHSHSHVGRFDERLEYLDKYPLYGHEFVDAVTNANKKYGNALKLADSIPSYSEHRMAIAFANHEFIEDALEIVKNCTDENNTMCNNISDFPNNLDGYKSMYFMIIVFVCFIVLPPLCVGNNWLRCSK